MVRHKWRKITKIIVLLLFVKCLLLVIYEQQQLSCTWTTPDNYHPRRIPQPLCTTRRNRFVYIKIQKTGGTTLCNHILEPYGFGRNLSFVIEDGSVYHLGYPYNFMPSMVLPPLKEHHDILTQETRYNLKSLQHLMPNDTVYIFSFRKPIERFLSAFYFTKSPDLFRKTFEIDDMDPALIMNMFFTDPKNILKLMLEKARDIKFNVHPKADNALIQPSSQMFSLGLDDANSMADIHKVAKQILSEFETFVLTEYFDESMVLLKRTMCWDLQDVLYNNIFNKRQNLPDQLTVDTLPDDLRRKILDYNRADAIFYNYANETFWERIGREKNFDKELAEYKKMKKDFNEYCSNKNTSEHISPIKKNCVNKSTIRSIYGRQKWEAVTTCYSELRKNIVKVRKNS